MSPAFVASLAEPCWDVLMEDFPSQQVQIFLESDSEVEYQLCNDESVLTC